MFVFVQTEMWRKQKKIIATHAKKDPNVLTHAQEDTIGENNIDPRTFSTI